MQITPHFVSLITVSWQCGLAWITGNVSFEKMSIRIRRTARMEQSAIAIDSRNITKAVFAETK